MSVSAVASASLATEITYPILVNGYLCYSTADVQSARSGGNPKKDAASPSVQTMIPSASSQAAPSAATVTRDAVSAVPSTPANQGTATDDLRRWLDPARARGSVLDILA